MIYGEQQCMNNKVVDCNIIIMDCNIIIIMNCNVIIMECNNNNKCLLVLL